jgi:hypothetical protein
MNNEQSERNFNLDPVNTVLERVENVRVSGNGYRGDCPNGHRSRGNLSIIRRDDGTPWITCFAGCETEDVLHTLGLEWKDLFWRQDYHRMTPQEKREIRGKARQSGWKTALELLPLEIAVVECTAVKLAKGQALNESDMARLILAGERIRSVWAVLCGH